MTVTGEESSFAHSITVHFSPLDAHPANDPAPATQTIRT